MSACSSSGAVSSSNQGLQPILGKDGLTITHLCKLGQELVQEIVIKTSELFSLLKLIQPSNGTAISANAQEEKRIKIQECQKTIDGLFKRLKVLYNKCLETCAGLEYIQIESLIPFKESSDSVSKPLVDEKKSPEYDMLAEKHAKYVEVLRSKNRHLKDIIDSLRNLMWEINTMLAMKKS